MTEDLLQSEFYDSVANKIRLARQMKGVDQETLARLLNLSRASIINIEKGRQRPSIYQLWQMARFLSIPFTELIPLLEMHDNMEEWKAKIGQNTEVITAEDQKVLIGFISATMQSI